LLIPKFLLYYIANPPKSVYNEYNKMILTKDILEIDKDFIYKKMLVRYVIVIVLCLFIHGFCWYYMAVFCAVYRKSSATWIWGGIISLILKFLIIQTSIPLILVIFRYKAFKNPTR